VAHTTGVKSPRQGKQTNANPTRIGHAVRDGR
jgi:hypothetical protein